MFVWLKIHLSTQKKTRPPMKFATMVVTVAPSRSVRNHTHRARIGVEACQRSR